MPFCHFREKMLLMLISVHEPIQNIADFIESFLLSLISGTHFTFSPKDVKKKTILIFFSCLLNLLFVRLS